MYLYDWKILNAAEDYIVILMQRNWVMSLGKP